MNFLPFILLALVACNTTNSTKDIVLPEALDYAKNESWFGGDSLSLRSGGFDVFFIVPTVTWPTITPSGDTMHYMDPKNIKQLQSFDGSALGGYRMMAERAGARFFSPYYRQITIDVWSRPRSDVDQMLAVSIGDVKRAFDHYITVHNNGRPFILAGHSQGSCIAINILKNSLTADQYSRMIATYAIGFQILPKDTLNTYVRPAKDSIDSGVTISFNSVSSASAQSPVLNPTYVCINPLNWATNDKKADKSTNPGSVWLNKDGSIAREEAGLVGAQIDTQNKVVIVDGVNPADYFSPSLASLFPLGNYHTSEMIFYFRAIEDNVQARARHFIENKR